ncbi:hypothetical protein GGX14DRAFT_578448 [Mycena pura]|uniref:Uncharacterized protein n=1 Tax=Mycena pura TaxID=153505 RepID=A0AAD6UPI2_9AGAR|nr:hypothetical protein GGX14DRAFT_578448 [Mycena pura]
MSSNGRRVRIAVKGSAMEQPASQISSQRINIRRPAKLPRKNASTHARAGIREQKLRLKDQRLRANRLSKLHVSREVANLSKALGDHKRLGVLGILSAYDKAAAGIYKPKSYTEQDRLRAFLIWKLAGNRVAHFAHRALGLPSKSTARRHITGLPIQASPGKPTVAEISKNISAAFDSEGLFTPELGLPRPVHAVLMYDEAATEKRVRYDVHSNRFVGPCRPHAQGRINLEFNSERDVEDLFAAVDDPDPARCVHIASEATVETVAKCSGVV